MSEANKTPETISQSEAFDRVIAAMKQGELPHRLANAKDAQSLYDDVVGYLESKKEEIVNPTSHKGDVAAQGVETLVNHLNTEIGNMCEITNHQTLEEAFKAKYESLVTSFSYFIAQQAEAHAKGEDVKVEEAAGEEKDEASKGNDEPNAGTQKKVKKPVKIEPMSTDQVLAKMKAALESVEKDVSDALASKPKKSPGGVDLFQVKRGSVLARAIRDSKDAPQLEGEPSAATREMLENARAAVAATLKNFVDISKHVKKDCKETYITPVDGSIAGFLSVKLDSKDPLFNEKQAIKMFETSETPTPGRLIRVIDQYIDEADHLIAHIKSSKDEELVKAVEKHKAQMETAEALKEKAEKTPDDIKDLVGKIRHYEDLAEKTHKAAHEAHEQDKGQEGDKKIMHWGAAVLGAAVAGGTLASGGTKDPETGEKKKFGFGKVVAVAAGVALAGWAAYALYKGKNPAAAISR